MSDAKVIFILAISLSLFGLLMVGSSSVVDAARNFSDKWYYFKLQAGWLTIAAASLVFFSKFDHLRLQKYAFTLYLSSLVLLVLVLIPGIGNKIMGARRWIDFGLFTVQPAEVAKLCSAIYFSSLLTKTGKHAQFVVTSLAVIALIILEPDLGTALVVTGMCVALYFGSGGQLKKLFIAGLLGIIAVGMVILISPYRLGRVKSFLDISHDPLGSSYQIRQALIALGSGGPFGVGLGQSRQKYAFLPETTTDSIFAIIGEELGLMGTLPILGCYLALVLRGLKVAREASNKFSSNLALCLISVIGFQAFLNISAISALAPLTGIPLTFISYGGSSLVIMLTSTGILINIAKKNA